MMLDRYSDPRSRNSFKVEPTYEPVNYGADYFPQQRPLSSGQLGGPHAAGLADQDKGTLDVPPSRGFAVIRGGKANYENPYASLATQPGPARSQSADVGPSAGSGATLAPPVDRGGGHSGYGERRPSHGRTKSQTAVIEIFPGSGTPSPVSGTPPFTTPMVEHPPFAVDQGQHLFQSGSGVDPLASAYWRRNEGPAGGRDSPVSTYSSEATSTKPTPKKSSQPASWFSKQSRVGSHGPTALGAPTAQGSGWRDRLGLGPKEAAIPDEKVVDENATRKQELAAYEAALNTQTNTSSSSSGRAPVLNSPLQPSGTSSAQSSVGRSFVVKRPQQGATPVLPPAATDETPQMKRSFVVNRPSTAR